MVIIIKNILIKIHYSIRLVKYYYSLFYQIHSIIIAKFRKIKSKLILQIFSKVLNNLTGLNNLVPILLVFDFYLYIININLLLFTIN